MWDFLANKAVDTVDIVPEEFRPLYAEDKTEGKFILRPEVAPLAESFTAVSKKYNDLSRARKEDNAKDAARRTSLKALSDTFSELGWDLGDDETKLPEIVKSKVSEIMDQVKGGKEVKLNIEAVRKDFEKKMGDLATKKDGEIAAMKTSLEKYMVNAAAASTLSAAGTVEKGVEFLMPHITKAVRVVQDDNGEYAVRVVDGDNNVRFDSRGNPMAISGLVEELKQTFPMAFRSANANGGSGKPPDSSNRGKAQPTNQTMTPNQKIAAGLSGIMKGK